MNRSTALFALVILVFSVAGAMEETEPAGEVSPPTAYLGDANQLVRDGKFEEAEILLAELQKEFPADVSLLLMRGEQLLQLQRPADARDVLLEAANLDGNRERIQFQLGSALVQLNMTDEALERFGAELNNTDDQAIIRLSRLNRSMLFERGKRWTEAARELEELLGGEATDNQLFADLVSLYLRDDSLDQAADALTRGREAGFESALHYYNVGAHFFRAKRHKEAQSWFVAALSTDPGMARAERSLAAVLNKLERPGEAIVHLRRYLELDPDAADAENVREQIRALTTEAATAP